MARYAIQCNDFSGVAVQAWMVENLRVTGFTVSEPAESAEDLWAALVGSPPERIDKRVREGATNVVGSFEGAQLALSRTRLRTDWVWLPEPGSPESLSVIGDFEKIRDTFSTFAKKWLSRDSSFVRMAYAGILLSPVPSKEDGYTALNEYLPHVKLDPKGSSDFSYQINRPRTSKVVEGLRINRLSIWSVSFIQTMSMQFTLSAGAAEAVASPTSPGHSACRLNFDVNSDLARKEPFPRKDIIPLFEELADLSREITVRGDVP